ncbi:hypothetical protein XENORESO_010877 [Xenotaenia resolanae]|uniref:Uncharacterized protein n=1 Tax=Xenotaenia resolanae TaxID=208358 RepID=A0ABV0X1P2_9TELE
MVSNSLIDLLFSHVVTDHWTGQSNPSLSDTSLQEVRVSVQEVGVLPSTSTVPPDLDRYVGLDEAGKRHGYTHQDSQTDCEVVSLPDSKLDETQSPTFSREGTNIEVCVEIETHPRGARHSSLSSMLSSRSLSAESVGHSQDYPCASGLDERREAVGLGVDLNRQEKLGRKAREIEETCFQVIEAVDV